MTSTIKEFVQYSNKYDYDIGNLGGELCIGGFFETTYDCEDTWENTIDNKISLIGNYLWYYQYCNLEELIGKKLPTEEILVNRYEIYLLRKELGGYEVMTQEDNDELLLKVKNLKEKK